MWQVFMIYYFGNQSGDTTRWFVIRFVIRRGCITHIICVKSSVKTRLFVMKTTLNTVCESNTEEWE